MADFDMGRAVRRTFEPLRRNPVTFFGLAFLLVGVPGAIMQAYQASALAGSVLTTGAVDPNDPFTGMGRLFGVIGVVFLGSLIVYALLQGTLIHAAVADYRGRKATIGESLSNGLRTFLPIVVISILFFLGMMLGLFLLVVPGIFLAIKWIVAVPAQATEQAGIIGAFGRSWRLTKGAWWPIFGLAVLYYVIQTIVGLVLAVPLGTLGAYSGDPTAALEAATGWPVILTQLVAGTINGAIAAAGVAAIYYELRQQKEGAGADDLARVFA